MKSVKMYIYIKRIFDIFISIIVLIFLFPLMIILAILIKVDSKGPILFKQERVGKDKKNFRILKYRTMRVDAPKDIPTHILKNSDAYITRIGRFLRKTSLDELPQIVNIIKGEMSIVGPRPALWNQYDLIKERERYGANSILPGLTGWAQVNGRDELSIPIKAKYDGEYVEKISIVFDIKILISTIINVCKKKGIVEGTVNND